MEELLAANGRARAYVLDKQGADSWTQVSEHLPPVYALRFERVNH